jgi:glycosyltransferase involved in cell wall biosynthesis
MPQVSVIVPNYNHATYLKLRIDSILNQTYQDLELILLDDCSTDHSRDILLEYSNHPKVSHCVFNEQNSGSTFRQWDKGIELAQGEYIWIAESDDWAENNFLEVLIAGLIEYPDAGLVYSASALIDSAGNCTYQNVQDNVGQILCYTGKDFVEQKMLTANSIWNASMILFRRSLLTQTVNDEYRQMKYSGDWFLYVQLALNTHVLEIKQTLNHYRVHDENVSTNAKITGKYFTEGFRVFIYISTIDGIDISQRVLIKWAKMYLKDNERYSFASDVRKEILHLFYQYNPLINMYILLGRFVYALKK